MNLLVSRYSPEQMVERRKEIDWFINNVCLVEVTIEHMTGKEAIELVHEKQGME